MVFAVRDDDAVGTAHADAERFHIHTFIANTHAAEAKNTARRIIVDKLRPFLFRPVNFFLHEAAGIRAVAKHHVLQLALAALVAHRAIERMVRQKKFKHGLARAAHLLRVRSHHHALGGHERARRLQLRHFFHFHQTHAAGGLQR
jgi:hypothetical protein